MGKITRFFKPLIEPVMDAMDRTVASAAEALVKNAGGGNGQQRQPEALPLPRETGGWHANHRASMRAFLDRRWQTNLHRRRDAAHKKRMRLSQNHVNARPHG